MTDSIDPGPLQPAALPPRAPAAGGAQSAPGKGVEFQALLERIEARATELARRTEAVEAPEQLAEAVHTARESLEDVLLLKQRLLEAYQEERRRGAANGG
jgi:hypothetical protein